MSAAAIMLSRHKPRRGKTLVVGSKVYGKCIDRRTLYKDAVGVDMLGGAGVDIVHDMEQPLNAGPFSHIDCCSVLEHVRRPWLMAENIQRIMIPKSSILLVVPFVWRLHGYPSDYWRYTPEALPVLFPEIKWREILLISNDQVLERPRAFNDCDGNRWLSRTEIAGFGIK